MNYFFTLFQLFLNKLIEFKKQKAMFFAFFLSKRSPSFRGNCIFAV